MKKSTKQARIAKLEARRLKLKAHLDAVWKEINDLKLEVLLDTAEACFGERPKLEFLSANGYEWQHKAYTTSPFRLEYGHSPMEAVRKLIARSA